MSDTLTLNTAELDGKVRQMYRAVAERPDDSYHFAMGRSLAEQLGYPGKLLDRLPGEAVQSFAGVGYFLDLAGLAPGEAVLDLGSGSGADSFAAALGVGPSGRIVGIDITPQQLAKAERLRRQAGLEHVRFMLGRIERLPCDDASFDVVISNGVINLAPDKQRVFAEAARVLRPGGRLVLADIVSRDQLSTSISCNADLWASCIGGAAHFETYRREIEAAGFAIERVRPNRYEFLSRQAREASASYGVHSVSIFARRSA
jgi:arsenite methyltransferase